ncbi:MAG: carbon monoxide dehydrogenase subunit G [Alphaproteobacteria bacterium]|nr:carbon monoxide dehydrogenase subunit G [Alphaproteobacteria bacterium]
MNLSGSVAIAAPRERLWAALNDPDVLARCIDGVEQLVRTDGDVPSFDGTLNARVGPVRAKFAGQVRLEDIVAPERYRLVGEGKGGVAGFAKGAADVRLTSLDAGNTRLDYVVDAQVGGKLAQLGARLIEGTAKAYAEHFFAALKTHVEGADEAAPPPEPAAPAATTPGMSPLLWGGGLMLLVLLFLGWQWLAGP